MSVTEIGRGVRLAVLPRWLPLAVVFVAALIVRAIVPANTDVSWGLTMAEKWLDGARLYIDIIEVNPPATVYLYVLPAWLARLTGLRAEILVDALVFLAAGLSLSFSARALRLARLFDTVPGDALLALMAAAVMVLPAHVFGEREHVALIAFLPLLAVMARRAEGASPDWLSIVVAGIGGGFVAIIKPYLAAALVTTALAAAVYARNWRIVFAAENFIAAGLLAVYVGFVLLVYPEFNANMVPLLMLAYVPVKENLFSFYTHVAIPLWVTVLLLTARLIKRQALALPFGLLMAASVGFSISYFVQRKGWPYHSYPMIALALVMLALAVIRLWRQRAETSSGPLRSEWIPAGCAAVGMAVVAFIWFNLAEDRQALAAAIRTIKPHPKIVQFSVDLSVGHPLTRQVGGVWVGRAGQLWMTLGAEFRRDSEKLDAETAARLEAITAYDRQLLAEDIARERPDVILVQRSRGFDWMAWANADPAMAAQIKAYRADRTVDDMVILRRADDG